MPSSINLLLLAGSDAKEPALERRERDGQEESGDEEGFNEGDEDDDEIG